MLRTIERSGATPPIQLPGTTCGRYATPTGRIADPMLTIQTTSDGLITDTDVSAYNIPAALAGTADRFVARFVEAEGPCNFTAGQIGNAFDALLAWPREGRRPAPGEQK